MQVSERCDIQAVFDCLDKLTALLNESVEACGLVKFEKECGRIFTKDIIVAHTRAEELCKGRTRIVSEFVHALKHKFFLRPVSISVDTHFVNDETIIAICRYSMTIIDPKEEGQLTVIGRTTKIVFEKIQGVLCIKHAESLFI